MRTRRKLIARIYSTALLTNNQTTKEAVSPSLPLFWLTFFKCDQLGGLTPGEDGLEKDAHVSQSLPLFLFSSPSLSVASSAA